MLPRKSRKLIEIGCSSGALAREYKKVNPDCFYIGLDIVESYTRLAERFCDQTIVADIEKQDDSFFNKNKDCDCWIFADTLEHLVNPWLVLKKVRQIIPTNGHIVACIPNAQNWRVVANLAIGNFRYQDSGLLDKTHLRWFTRETIIELFDGAGFEIEAGNVRIFEDPNNITFLPIIGEIAKFLGANAEVAIQDSIPFQYVVRAKPK
jgi:2-polyprenyl-3-methyl-5-hydroxy-6-metoxy-1,4-benzoquinol methylase